MRVIYKCVCSGLSDPFVVLTLNGTSVRSKTVLKTLNPGTQPPLEPRQPIAV